MDVTTLPRMPAAFLGHGSPMNALETNRYTTAWRSFGALVPKPRGIVVISAHWYINYTAVTAMTQPHTIHDFFGFPEVLFEMDYPAPGDPSLAEEVADLAKPERVGLDRDSWGLDHGAWSVLVHAFPEANVPVVQLSINATRAYEWHVTMGQRLAKLRDSGVLILGSGNIVHNLRTIDWKMRDEGFDWARRFDERAREVLTTRPSDVLSLQSHPDFRRAVPTAEHFLPILYLAGLADAAGRPLDVLVDGYAFGSLSMTCFGLEADCPRTTSDRPAASLPDPRVIAAEDTNT